MKIGYPRDCLHCCIPPAPRMKECCTYIPTSCIRLLVKYRLSPIFDGRLHSILVSYSRGIREIVKMKNVTGEVNPKKLKKSGFLRSESYYAAWSAFLTSYRQHYSNWQSKWLVKSWECRESRRNALSRFWMTQ